jgi:hypothetical protein
VRVALGKHRCTLTALTQAQAQTQAVNRGKPGTQDTREERVPVACCGLRCCKRHAASCRAPTLRRTVSHQPLELLRLVMFHVDDLVSPRLQAVPSSSRIRCSTMQYVYAGCAFTRVLLKQAAPQLRKYKAQAMWSAPPHGRACSSQRHDLTIGHTQPFSGRDSCVDHVSPLSTLSPWSGRGPPQPPSHRSTLPAAPLPGPRRPPLPAPGWSDLQR